VGQVLASLDLVMALTLAETGRQALGQREWAANVVTDYRFSKTSVLQGWNVGCGRRTLAVTITAQYDCRVSGAST
jgi:hypothetical protein